MRSPTRQSFASRFLSSGHFVKGLPNPLFGSSNGGPLKLQAAAREKLPRGAPAKAPRETRVFFSRVCFIFSLVKAEEKKQPLNQARARVEVTGLGKALTGVPSDVSFCILGVSSAVASAVSFAVPAYAPGSWT